MPDRLQFLSKRKPDSELSDLLEQAKKKEITEAELHEQRVSFAYGNALGSESVTKDSVRRASENIRIRA